MTQVDPTQLKHLHAEIEEILKTNGRLDDAMKARCVETLKKYPHSERIVQQFTEDFGDLEQTSDDNTLANESFESQPRRYAAGIFLKWLKTFELKITLEIGPDATGASGSSGASPTGDLTKPVDSDKEKKIK